MNHVVKLLLLTCNFLFSITVLYGQVANQTAFKLENDNRTVKINTLFRNNLGYIYAGTDNGLYKFDGIKYTRINFSNADFNDTVTAIFQDRSLTMWIGFRSGRIANIINNKLHYFNPEEGTPQKKITSFLEDSENNLWFSVQGEGIYCLKRNRLYLINTDDGLSDNNVSRIVLADNDEILAGTDQGLNICTFKNGKKQVVVFGPKEGLPDYIVTTIIKAGKNAFWVGLQDNGFCLYDRSNNKITTPIAANDWKYGQVNTMLQAHNILWIATQDKGFYQYNPATKSIRLQPEPVAGNNINDILEDKQGNLWLSSSENGLIRSPGASLKLIPVPGSLPFEHIHTLLCDRNGNMWLTNKDNELIRLSIKNGKSAVSKIRLSGINGKTDITSLYEDLYGNIWVGSMGKGIYIIDSETFRYRVLNENSQFINSSILSISGKNNSIFCSSLSGAMVIELLPGNRDIFNNYRYINYDNKSTGTNYIYSIFKDSRERVWFATDGKGLTMLQNNRFTYYNNPEKIKDNRIYSITEDRKGNIWFSTSNAGIYKFNGKSFENFSISEGISNLNISVLKTDNAGNIVVVHKTGLDILDPETRNISYISTNQGLSEINAQDIGAVTNDTAGNILLSTRDGILTYTSVPNNLKKPVTIIESVELFLNEINGNESKVFSHDENNFTFNYTGLYYTDPEKVYYKYKLEGFDSNWVFTSDRTKNFPKLEPGRYTFRIQSALNRNFKNADEASYTFTIKQAFYKTWWFILGCFVVFAFVLYLYIKTREKELKKLEKLRQEKIQFQFEVLRNQINPHFLFNSFNTLISAIEDEPLQAVEYAEHLSAFFRNVVNQRDKDLISLGEEINHLYSYIFIQEKRYGEWLMMNILVSEEQKKVFTIPPLSLQLLLENAIKHNAVSKEAPLQIQISVTENNYLAVRNNKNAKSGREKGAGLGLQNIISRYRLLTDRQVTVINNEQEFIILLPLLK